MQVKFKLPAGGSGIPASMKCNHIRGEVLLWCARYFYLFQEIELDRVKGKGLVATFKNEDMYNTFRLTWDGVEYERLTK
jgi:hypothetical protein